MALKHYIAGAKCTEIKSQLLRFTSVKHTQMMNGHYPKKSKSTRPRLLHLVFLLLENSVRKKKVTIPLFVDDISSPEKNTFEKIYAVWPERGFVFVDGKIEFINYAKIEQGVLWAPEIETWLAQNVK